MSLANSLSLQPSNAPQFKPIEFAELEAAKIPQVCLDLILSYAGDPTLPNTPTTYKFILDAYRGQEILSRFTAEIPENLPLLECQARVMAIYSRVMELAHQASTDAPFLSIHGAGNNSIKAALEMDFTKGMAPMALAPIMEKAAPVEVEDFAEFFGDVCKRIPANVNLREFLLEIEDLPKAQKVNSMRKWLNANPNEIATITAFSLGHHNLVILSYEIQLLVNLKTLSIGGNRLEAPYALKNLTHLEELSYQTSGLTQVPDAIQFLESLKKLKLAANTLSALPEWFEKLTKLEELDLQYNQFTQLPDVLMKMKALKTVNIKNNPLRVGTTIKLSLPSPARKFKVVP